MGATRPIQMLWLVGAGLFLLAVYSLHSVRNADWLHPTTEQQPTDPAFPLIPAVPPETKPAPSRPSFYDIAKKYGTDKVTTHKYHHMYQKYLEPLRDQKLKMLEIGLGCNMNYGPGASYYTWLEFLPNVELYYIEYNKACAEKWAHKTDRATIFTGDQADVEFLKRFLFESGGEFDVIIDDGGHTMKQQLTSFDTLFGSAVKPGGVYFIEDLQTSYMPHYGGSDKMGKPREGTMMERIKGFLDEFYEGDRPKHGEMREVYSVDCMKEVCAFFRKEVGVEY